MKRTSDLEISVQQMQVIVENQEKLIEKLESEKIEAENQIEEIQEENKRRVDEVKELKITVRIYLIFKSLSDLHLLILIFSYHLVMQVDNKQNIN